MISPYHTASSPSLAPSPKTSTGALSMVSGSASNGLHSSINPPANSHSECLDYGTSANPGSIIDKNESTSLTNPVTEHSSSGLPGHLSSSAAWKYQSFQVL